MMFWALITCLLFSGIVGWMLRFFPETFTLGEALTISQGVTFLLFDTASQILHKVNIYCGIYLVFIVFNELLCTHVAYFVFN